MRYAGSRPSHHGLVKDLTCSGRQVRINRAIVLGGGYTVTGRRQGGRKTWLFLHAKRG